MEVLTEIEVKTLVGSVLAARGPAGAAEAELTAVVDWARQVRVDETLLRLVLEGRALIDFQDGEVVLKQKGS